MFGKMKYNIITILILTALMFSYCINDNLRPPEGKFVINNDLDEAYTRNVTLNIEGILNASYMKFSNTIEGLDGTTWIIYKPEETIIDWTLSGDNGEKTVYAKFKSDSQEIYETSDSIKLNIAPVGNVQINNGDDITKSNKVKLDMSDIENSHLMRFGNTEEERNNADWITFNDEYDWVLDAENGLKTVYAEFKNVYDVCFLTDDHIILDMTLLPTPSLMGTTPTNDSTPTWSWNNIIGAVLYRHSFDNMTWTETVMTSYTPLNSLEDGDHTLYVQAQDKWENWSESGSYMIFIDTVPPEVPVIEAYSTTINTYTEWKWQDITDAVYFNVDINDVAYTSDKSEFILPFESPFGAEYVFKVSSVDNCGNESAEAVFTTKTANVINTIIDDTSDAGGHNSIAVDSLGYTHISYYDNTNNALKYKSNKTGDWIVETVADNFRGKYNSIAVDQSGFAHISYYNENAGYLEYAENTSGNWVIEVLDNDDIADVGQYTSITIDSSGYINISYYDADNIDLKYVENTTGAWNIHTIDNTTVGQYNSITTDINDSIHISYYNSGIKALMYATNKSGVWKIFTVDNNADVGRFTSVSADSMCNAHIIYFNETSFNLSYTEDTTGDWLFYTLEDDLDIGEYADSVIDENDKLHISCYDYTNNCLRYLTNKNDIWESNTIDRDESVGKNTSIVMDNTGKIHISHSKEDTTTGENTLKYSVIEY